MPYKSEKLIIEGTNYDRRRKLTEEQKDQIIALKGEVSQSFLAKKFNVSRRTISFLWYPERLVRNLQVRKERGGAKIYYNKDKHRETVKAHRRYKQELYLMGNIMHKETISKTYYYTTDSSLFMVFGLDGDNNEYIITKDNIDSLRTYVISLILENPKLKECLKFVNMFEKELENVEEIQIKKS